jgi:AraC family transcriptional regulator
LPGTKIAVTQIKCDVANNGLTAPIPPENAHLVTVQLRDCPKYELWIDGRGVQTAPLKAGTVNFYDLRLNPVANSISPFHSLHFYVPNSALDAIADAEGCSHTDRFDNDPGIGVEDRAIFALALSLLPAFERPAEANLLFVDHITLAATAHLLRAYGAGVRPIQSVAAKLAAWQERRIKEILRSRLDGNASVLQLAEACGLSLFDFARAFRKSTGLAPHQWLLRHRIDCATAILRDQPNKSLTEVASECGYASMSHFVRSFSAATGSHPDVWREDGAHCQSIGAYHE